MDAYDWVSGGSITKFHRAVKVLKDSKQEVTEDAVKALYLKYGGLVIGDPSTQKGVEEGEIAFAVLPESERVKIVADAKSKRGKK